MTLEQKERLSISHRGKPSWNKGLLGFRHSGSFQKGHVDLVPIESRIVAGEKLSNEKHPNWKGGDAGYSTLHVWVARHFGKPKQCEHCGEVRKKMEWANVSGTYLRLRYDWKRLCVRCHRLYDDHPFFNPRTKEEKIAMSERMKGEKNHFFGKHHSEETRRKISLINIGNHNATK